jgi:hypothetical protein
MAFAIEVKVEDFPPNSHKSKMAKPEVQPAAKTENKDRPEVVATGKVRKKGLGSRFKEAMFGGEDIKTVIENVVFEVMIPAAKDMMADAFMETINRKLGSNVGRRVSRSVAAHSGPIAYNRFAQTTVRESTTRPPIGVRARRGNYEVEEILFDTRSQAASTLDEMRARLNRYGAVSVMDFYDMVGQTGNHVDEKWGWVNLSSAGVANMGREGYMITLPDAAPLD